jgi:diaminopimelate epimerase
MMKFAKLQATGNDFILVDARRLKREWSNLAQAMCQRHFGVGADGLILVQSSEVADLKMRIFNPDGSEAEACGNGLRCLAKYSIERGITSKTSFTVETLSGVRQVKAYMSRDKASQVKVSMGMPQFQPELIPVLPAAANPVVIASRRRSKLSETSRSSSEQTPQSQPILNYPLVVKGRKLTLSPLSMGNPHAVSFLSEPVVSFPLAEIGPEVERHPMFPQRANFEIARVLNKGEIEARVWERGVGETLSCGSGACAIAVTAQLLNYTGDVVDIILPGGTLIISWDRVGEVWLTGPVEEVFTGERLT